MTLQEVPAEVVAALFAPERPGPLIQQHVCDRFAFSFAHASERFAAVE